MVKENVGRVWEWEECLRYPNHIRPRDKSFHVGTFRIMSIFSVISTK